MPNKPMKPCRHPGCLTLTSEAYCPEHAQLHVRKERSGEAEAWHRWYRLPVWQELRASHLLEHPWCEECRRNGLRVRATDVDHVRDHRGRWDLFVDPGNLQSLCHSCHSRKTYETMQKAKRPAGR